MSWSIAQVARMSGVTARALRHYDEIGLLKPAFVGANGYRYYEEPQLLRLQQILVLRELGVSLGEIAAAIDAEKDLLGALRRHRTRLLAERDRMARLVATVERTIAELEQTSSETGFQMGKVKINRPENLFEGFDPTQYEDEARERWPEQYGQSQAYVSTLTADDTARIQRETTAAMVRMAELMAAGTPVDAEEVQAEVDAHYRGVCRFWTPNAAAYLGLGQMCVDDERFRATYEKIAPGLAEYQRDAMAVYAAQRLN